MPYTSVSFIFTGHTNEYNVKTDLESYEWLRYVPECFEAIQRLLCAVHLPKCENGTVSKIPYKVCHNAHKDCSVLKRWGTDKQKKGEITYLKVTISFPLRFDIFSPFDKKTQLL